MKALLTIMFVFPSFIIAQEKTAVILPDSTDVFIDGLEHFSEPLKMDDTKFKHEGLNREEIVTLPYSDSVRLDPSRFKEKYYYPVHHIGDYNLGGPMFMFRNGMVVGSGSFVTLHGIGFLGKAKIGYIHQFNDRLSLGGYVNTTKFRTANYDFISLGTSGVLNYKLTDRIELKGFGAYEKYNRLPAIMNYGATVSFDIVGRFGMETGVQRYYDWRSSRWETVPMVIPYIKMGKNSKLGIDIVPVIQETVKHKMR